MTTTNFLTAIAADLNRAEGAFRKASDAYEAMQIKACDTLRANGKAPSDLLAAGDTRTEWRAAVALAYLNKAEHKLWASDKPRRDKNLVTDENKNGQTPRGLLVTRIEKRADEIAKALAKVFSTDAAETEEKVAAKKGAKANAERDLIVRIAEEISKLIKAIDRDAAAEAPKYKKHGVMKAALDKASAECKAAQK